MDTVSKFKLEVVTVSDFEKFVADTKYITDAEKFGWSIVQQDIKNFEIVEDVTWRKPDRRHKVSPDDPVTQVSYNDAIAYSKWAGVRIPSYKEYWLLLQDNRPVNVSSTRILSAKDVNILGNTWEITEIDQYGRVRLAGGSFLCDKNTCNGTDETRELFVDSLTGNSHIGFAVITGKN